MLRAEAEESMTGEWCPPDYILIPIDNDGVGDNRCVCAVLTIIADRRWGSTGLTKYKGKRGCMEDMSVERVSLLRL